jgi:multicomponent Na+:H+ antiporter subunit A
MSRTRSIILDVGVRAVFHTVGLFALFLLFSGHNAPGGGFVAGLVAGAAFFLQDVASGFESARPALRVAPETLIATGLLGALATGIGSLVAGQAFLESDLAQVTLPLFDTVKVTTALAFDIGVFLVVLGVVLTMLQVLGKEPSG